MLQFDDDQWQAARCLGYVVFDMRRIDRVSFVVLWFEETDVDISLRLVIALFGWSNMLFNVCIDGSYALGFNEIVEFSGQILEEVVVELHDGREGTPVGG